VFETNLIALLLAVQYVSPGMLLRKSRKIINVCSLLSELGQTNIAPYITAKVWLKRLTELMVVEWEKTT